MPLTILSDSDVRKLLDNLNRHDVEYLLGSLRQALHEYSTGTSNDGACAVNQPERTVIESSRGNTTLFMPSTSSSGIGMKVVTLATAHRPSSPNVSYDDIPTIQTNTNPQGALTLMGSDGKPFGFLNAEELTAFRTALASSLLLTRRRKVKNIVVFGVGKQAYWHVRLALLLHGPTIKHVQFINRSFSDRAKDCLKAFISHDLGEKETEGWQACKFAMITTGYGEYERLVKEQIRQADVIFTTTPSTKALFDHSILTNTEGRKKGRLIVAIGSYTKNMIEVPPELLVQATKKHGGGHHFHKHAEEGGVIIVDTLSCVNQTGELTQAGIKEVQTVELGELVMLERMDSEDDESAITDSPLASPLPDEPNLGNLNLGDGTQKSLSAVFGSSNSTSQPPSRKSSFSLSRNSSSFSLHKRSSSSSRNPTLHHERTNSTSSSATRKKSKKQTEKEHDMCRWLSTGNVVYKSVGMGLMDLVVGSDLVTLARERGVGAVVPDF